jgi:hypothetical protein
MRYTLLSFLLPKHFCLRAKPPSSDASSQGTSVELYNGMYISQTIGQQSATGNSTKKWIYYWTRVPTERMGKYINSNLTSDITTLPIKSIHSIRQFSIFSTYQ